MIIAKLKKLEASDGGLGAACSYSLDEGKPSAGAGQTENNRKSHTPEAELRMLSVPRDGWLGGPGRHFNFG
ncbi:hypothetical protein L2D14_12545 [Thalassospiraceae bacterium LMO-JJ14]|nr:hypothetical protein L2D14_12545 [Thalassospiraceae bacterium LMO-JJ14]